MNELDALHRQILSAPTSEDAARLLVQAACALCGWSGGLLTVAVRSGTLVVGHGLEPGVEEYFQDRASHVSLAERRHNRERIREQAIPGTSITIVSASQDFHVVPTTATQADAPVASTWRADDTLFVRMPGAKGEVVGALPRWPP